MASITTRLRRVHYLSPFLRAFINGACLMVLELIATRLVARHIGSSLTTWTAVIGVLLMGVSLGNVLGGKLADRANPADVVGPLFGLASFASMACLWVNTGLDLTKPFLHELPWTFRTVAVVLLDFLVPSVVFGAIGPVVTKASVIGVTRPGLAIGAVAFMGAAGSVLGTFLTGFWLIPRMPVSAVLTAVAGLLASVATSGKSRLSLWGWSAVAVCLAWNAIFAAGRGLGMVGQSALGLLLALLAAVSAHDLWEHVVRGRERGPRVAQARATAITFADLSALSFIACLSFMILEMAAGRLAGLHLGSGIYTWTSVVGVMIGGLSLGNLLGGSLAAGPRGGARLGPVLVLCSAAILSVLLLDRPPAWLCRWLPGTQGSTIASLLESRRIYDGASWQVRTLCAVASVFLLPSLLMGVTGPLLTAAAVSRAGYQRAGRAIAGVSAWGMAGCVAGTFLAGLVFFDVLGTQGTLLLAGTALAVSAAWVGPPWARAWPTLPFILCAFAFVPVGWFEDQGVTWGVRERRPDPNTVDVGIAYLDESNFYKISVYNMMTDIGQVRSIALDSVSHGYVVMGHPERLVTEEGQLFAQIAHRVASARAGALGLRDDRDVPLRVLFIGAGSYSHPRYIRAIYPRSRVDVAELDPAVTAANEAAMGLGEDPGLRTAWGDARRFVEDVAGHAKYDLILGDAFNNLSIPWHLATREFHERLADLLAPGGVYVADLIDVDWPVERPGTAAVPMLLGSWIKTSTLTFGRHDVFKVRDPKGAGRSAYIVAASRSGPELEDLGEWEGGPRFESGGPQFSPRRLRAEDIRALAGCRGCVVLTDDYAPVENLLGSIASAWDEK